MPENPFEQLRSHLSEQETQDEVLKQENEKELDREAVLERRKESVDRIGLLLSELKAVMTVKETQEMSAGLGGKEQIERLQHSDNRKIADAAEKAFGEIAHAEAAEGTLTAQEESRDWESRLEEVTGALEEEMQTLWEMSSHEAIQELLQEQKASLENTKGYITKSLNILFRTENTPLERQPGALLTSALEEDYLNQFLPNHPAVSLEDLTELAPELIIPKVGRLSGHLAGLERQKYSERQDRVVKAKVYPHQPSPEVAESYRRLLYIKGHSDILLTQPITDHTALGGEDPNFSKAIEYYTDKKEFEDLGLALDYLENFTPTGNGYVDTYKLKVASELLPITAAKMGHMFELQLRKDKTALPVFGLNTNVRTGSGQLEDSEVLRDVVEHLPEAHKKELEEIDEVTRKQEQESVENSITWKQSEFEKLTNASQEQIELKQQLEQLKQTIESDKQYLNEVSITLRELQSTSVGFFGKAKREKDMQTLELDIAERKTVIASNEAKITEIDQKLFDLHKILSPINSRTTEEQIEIHRKEIEKLKSIHYL